MKTLFILLLTFSALIALVISRNIKPKGFQIIGSTTGLADSTLIFLEDASTSSLLKTDSTFIIDGKFSFSGSLKENVSQVILRTRDFSDYKFLWIENSIITFRGERGKFRQATITGSLTQNDQERLDSAIITTGNEREQNILFIRNNPASIISAHTLSVYSSTWGKDTSAMLFNNLSQELKNTSYGKNISAFIKLNRNLKIGDRYVDFSQPNIHGKMVNLSDFTGKVILLEFWGSWCFPCRQGNPELVKTYSEFKGKGFEILGVAADSKREDWVNAMQKDGLLWPNVCDLEGDKNRAALIYGVSSYPANFLIDKTGVIVAKDLIGENLREKLKEIL